MRIKRLAVTAGLLAGLGTVVVAPAASAAPTTPMAPVGVTPQTGVAPLSCPPGGPAPDPGWRCLSWYPTLSECDWGVHAYQQANPHITWVSCQSSPNGWWGMVYPE
ncbi:hypothetical protein [Streptomyces sp. NPDC048172]|uniref:hypothetical protein n=1 Tax=Streptomyces sp. NPDC048172 TaxID=3365505 RepID=UPI00371080D3